MKVAAGLFRRLATFPITAPALLLLLMLSTAWLTHVARRELSPRDSLTQQLDLLSASLVMLQSFQVDSGQSVPEIWSERLGPEQASRRWRASRQQIWWKGWVPSGSSVL